MTEYKNIQIKDLVMLEKNPRTVTKSEMDKLCDSLVNDPTFLRCRPVLVNRIDGINHVYAGNQRVTAAKKLKWKEIYCSVEENLSDELMKQRILKDNRHAGEFDYDALANEWDLETLVESGFTPEELHLKMDSVDKDREDKEKEKKLKCCPNCGHEF